MTRVRTCRVCGCTDARACEGGCWWVEADLCSACKPGPADVDAWTEEADCDECGGAGGIGGLICEVCGGDGVVEVTMTRRLDGVVEAQEE